MDYGINGDIPIIGTNKTLKDISIENIQVAGILLNNVYKYLTDKRIIGAKRVIIYYYVNSSSNYYDSVTISNLTKDWFLCRTEENGVGYVLVDFTTGTINVSQYSHNLFKIFSYDIIYN